MGGRVAGKVALVTGAAKGIGRACAALLTQEGARVAVTDIQDEAGRACADALAAVGADAIFLHHDAASEEAWIVAVAAIKERWGRLDILVNNAGIALPGALTHMSLSDWRRQLAVNLDSVFLGIKHALPLMRASGGGSIINISSLAGLKGVANMGAYCAAKGGVRLLSKAAALECAGQRDGIRVNSVHPGIIETEIWERVLPELAAADSGSAAQTRDTHDIELDTLSKAVVPMGTTGLPSDVAAGVLFLASDESRYVSGSELVIDGGSSAR